MYPILWVRCHLQNQLFFWTDKLEITEPEGEDKEDYHRDPAGGAPDIGEDSQSGYDKGDEIKDEQGNRCTVLSALIGESTSKPAE